MLTIDRILPSLFIGLSVLACALAVGFFFHQPWALAAWPWTTSKLSDVFLASIAAAIAAPLWWIGWTREYAAVFGGALNLALVNAGLAIYAMAHLSHEGRLPFAAICALMFIACVAQLVWTRRLRFKDTRPTPALVRISFVVFSGLLMVLGGMLIAQAANIFPWPLKPEQQVLYGWIFVGAAAYFVYGCIVPEWGNERGQLWGFLAYDAVLLVPFLQHFATVRPDLLLNLQVYIAVILYSGVLAAFFLLVDPRLRRCSVRP